MNRDFLPNIENFVFLMLENRSFDNLMGWLYEHDQPAHFIDGSATAGQPFMGLQGGVAEAHGVTKVSAGALNTPDPDPHEPFLHVNKQLFNIDVPPCSQRADPPIVLEGIKPAMDGFLADYQTTRVAKFGLPDSLGVIADECGWLGKLAKLLTKQITPEQANQIMQTYTPEQLPAITSLARDYAVSDHWFSSVPTQTNANRAFSTSGTSAGLTDNKGKLFGFVPDNFNVPSIWDRLCEAGHESPSDWMIYYQQKLFWKYVFTQEAFSVPDAENHVAPIDDFFHRIETKQPLPKFSYLEPIWLGAHIGNNGNSYHPPAQLEPGEAFLRKLKQALQSNEEQWNKTLLMVTFDEHGGTFDHVPPPWGAAPPWQKVAGAFQQTRPKCEYNFAFNRFGVRVPTVLASPWIEPETVFRSTTEVPYDHTSMIATVLTWMGIPREEWDLGQRVANAPTFEGVLTRSTPRPLPHRGATTPTT